MCKSCVTYLLTVKILAHLTVLVNLGSTLTLIPTARKTDRDFQKNMMAVCTQSQRERHMPGGICEVVRENHGNNFAGRSHDDSTKMTKFWKNHWTVRQQWLVVTRPSADCRTTFFRRFKQFGKISKKKSLNGHATVVGGHATVGWLSNNVFFDVSSNSEKFWKKSLKVTRQWSEVTRALDDCQTTFFWRFRRFGKILKKVTEGHATVAGGHATVGWLSNNVF